MILLFDMSGSVHDHHSVNLLSFSFWHITTRACSCGGARGSLLSWPTLSALQQFGHKKKDPIQPRCYNIFFIETLSRRIDPLL